MHLRYCITRPIQCYFIKVPALVPRRFELQLQLLSELALKDALKVAVQSPYVGVSQVKDDTGLLWLFVFVF